MARRLSIEAFGQFAYGQWLIDLAFLVCSLGVTGVAGRYFAEYRHDPHLLAAVLRRWRPYAFSLPVLGGLLAFAGILISGMTLSPFATLMLVLWSITSGLWAMQTAALVGLQRFDLIFRANAIAATIMLTGAVLISLNGTDPGPVFGLIATAAGLAALVGLREIVRVNRGSPSTIDASRWSAIRQYAVNIWVTGLLWSLVWSRGEMPIIRAHLGDLGVAHYAAALTLFGGAIQGVMLAAAGTAPHLTRLLGEGSHKQAVALARKLLDVQLLACGLAAVTMIYFSSELMRLAFGPAYRSSAGVLSILSLGVLSMAASPQGHLLQIATNARFSRDSTLLGLAVLFALAGWLTSAVGLAGAAMARAATMLILGAISLYVVRKRWGRTAYSLSNVVPVSILVAASAAVMLLYTNVHWSLRAGLAAMSAVLLLIVVRDAEGRVHAKVIAAQLLHRLASPSR